MAAAKGHSYSAAVTAPTCTAKGYTTHTCSRCGDSYVDSYVDAKGHTEVTDAAVAATCTETGLTEGKHCSVCNEVLVAQEVVKAKGHTEVKDEAKDSTCETTGLTEGKHCSVCGAVLVAQEVIPAKGHSPGRAVTEQETGATVRSEGSYEAVIYCTVCGKELSRVKHTIPRLEDDSTQEAIIREESKQEANMRNADIADATSMIQKDIDLTSVAMPEDVSCDEDDDVLLDELSNCPYTLQQQAKKELVAALKKHGCKVDCGFAAWSKSGKTAACVLKLSEKDVPDGALVFVNGKTEQPELKDGYYCFEVTLPAVVLVAHK